MEHWHTKHPKAEESAQADMAWPQPSSEARTERLQWRRWWPIGGGLIGLAALAWVFLRIDYGRLQVIVAEADAGLLLLLPLAVTFEQLVRAWKWRQLLHPVKPVGTVRLFGAIMASYLANLLIPLGVSPLVRSWLVARLENLRMGTVLATVAIDRFIDGVIFGGLVFVVVLFAVFPDPTGDIRLGLVMAGTGSLVLFAFLLLALANYKGSVAELAGRTGRLVDRLPARLAARTREIVRSFSEGIVWPRAFWRRLGIVLATMAIKLVAATHFLWAGLAFGVELLPMEYLFLIVFVGLVHILTHMARVPGGFIVGSVFALGLFDVGEELALAMALVVQASSLVSVATIGAFTLWRNGVGLTDLRTGNLGNNGHR